MSTQEGKTILLVGGGQGIGLEASQYILSRAPADVKLVVFGLHIDEELQRQSHSDRLCILQGDVTKPSDRQKAVDTCLGMAGGIDSLVYCAGIITPIQTIEKVDLRGLQLAYEVNVFGAVAMVG
jgi:NAD(P)-dependent dehydrogenase (short-subunit alcohol dehydrogenase family)